ncbi:MAG: peptidoglycan bridge formation protein FemAB, partial [Polaromonas sp.]
MSLLPEHSTLTVKRLASQDLATAARWDEFVLACPDATFFHRAGWQKIVRDVFRHDTYFLYAEADGRIQGVLPL